MGFQFDLYSIRFGFLIRFVFDSICIYFDLICIASRRATHICQWACVNQIRDGYSALYAVFAVSKFCLSATCMSQPSGTSGMEDHSQNDPARRDQDEVNGGAALNRTAWSSG